MTDERKRRGVRLIDFLVISILIFFIPFTSLLAYLYYVELSNTVLKGFDEQLHFTTAGVGSYLDPSLHAQIAEYRQIRSIVSTPGGLIGVTGIGGEVFSLNTDLTKANLLGKLGLDVHDAAWLGERLYVAEEGYPGAHMYRIRNGEVVKEKDIEFPFVCNGLTANETGAYLVCLSEVALNISALDGTILGSHAINSALLATTALTTYDKIYVALVMGEEGNATFYELNEESFAVEKETPVQVDQSLFGVVSLPDHRLLVPGSWSFLAYDPSKEYAKKEYDLPPIAPASVLHQYVARGKALKEIRKLNHLTYLFTAVLKDDGKSLQYTIDSSQGWEHSMNGIVDPTEAEEGLRDVWFKGVPYLSGIKYWDEWGLLKSGYYPLKHDKKVTGMVGADVNIGIIEERRKSVLSSVILASTIGSVLALIFLWPVGLSIMKPIEKLRRKILQIAAGGSPFESSDKEFAALRDLYIQLETMRVEIDREKRKFIRDKRSFDLARESSNDGS